MKFALERVTQPASEPITLAQAKLHLRTFSGATALDNDITALIQGAREWVEEFTGRALIDQTWRLSIFEDAWNFTHTDTNLKTGINYGPWFPYPNGILLRKSPGISITSFATVDAAGVETVVSPSSYQLGEANSKWPRLVGLNGATWSGPLRLTFRAGYVNALGSPAEGVERIPVRLLQAMKLWIEANYDRKDMNLLLDVAERLIISERCELGLA